MDGFPPGLDVLAHKAVPDGGHRRGLTVHVLALERVVAASHHAQQLARPAARLVERDDAHPIDRGPADPAGREAVLDDERFGARRRHPDTESAKLSVPRHVLPPRPGS